jgi:hypothetical protein
LASGLALALIPAAAPAGASPAPAGFAPAEGAAYAARASASGGVSQPAAKKAHAVVRLAKPAAVYVGTATTLKGKVINSTSKRGVAKAKVAIQKYKSGKWITVGTAKTSAKGAFTFKKTISADTVYRAKVPATRTRGAGVSAAVTATVKRYDTALALTFTPSGQVTAGDTVTFTGTASGNLIGQNVALQILSGESWQDFGLSATVAPDGSFSLSPRILQAGAGQQFRVAYPGGTALSPSASAPVGIDVWGWYYLADKGFYEETGCRSGRCSKDSDSWNGGSVRINTTVYTKTVYLDDYYVDGSVQFDLQRACDVLKTTVGIPDWSDASAYSSFAVDLDGTRVWSTARVGLGRSVSTEINVVGTLRLMLSIISPTSGGVDAAFGDAQVHCLR